MGFLSMMAKGLKAMIDEHNTPESFKTGEKFECYVREFLFIGTYYDILERTHNYTTNKDYVESSLKPDFKLRDRRNKKEFYVEAKFRSSLYNNRIVWCNDKQLIRYCEYNKQNPVFLILGMGDDPRFPEFLSLIPIQHAKYTGIFPSHAEKFEIEQDKAVSSKILWSR